MLAGRTINHLASRTRIRSKLFICRFLGLVQIGTMRDNLGFEY